MLILLRHAALLEICSATWRHLHASVYPPKKQTQLSPGSRLQEDALLLHSPVLPGLKFLPPSISKFGPVQTHDPVSCPPPPPLSCWPPEGPSLMGALSRSPQKLPREEILFLLLQAGSYRMFLSEFFAFHVAECSGLVSHRSAAGSPHPTPSLWAGNSLAKDVLGPYLPSSTPPTRLHHPFSYVCCNQNKICQGAQKN